MKYHSELNNKTILCKEEAKYVGLNIDIKLKWKRKKKKKHLLTVRK